MKQPKIRVAIEANEIIAFEPDYMEIEHSLAMRIFKLMAGMGSKNHWKTKTKKEKKEHTQKARDMIKKK